MEASPRPKIALIYFDAGGGHRAAARALESVAREQGRPWQIELINLQEILDDIDPVHKLLRIRLADFYNRTMAAGWTLGAPALLKALHATIRLYRAKIDRRLQELWRIVQPQVVVSLIPNFNACLARSLGAALPETPFVTVLTDLADFPPHFWIERESQYIICGTERARGQARALGHGNGTVIRTSGMILNPKFYQPLQCDRAQFRAELGLHPELPTALVLFGGHASRDMWAVAAGLEFASSELQAIFICGHNARMRERLEQRRFRYRTAITGFTAEVPAYMANSDFLIGKPGPGVISEAIQMRLPVIVNRNLWTLPQERYNAEWVEEVGAGICIRDFRSIAPAADQMVRELSSYRARAAALENRAVFEVVESLDSIVRRMASTTPAAVV
ncbi:MAG: galactosyldiacylglycerol synthase [Acidobacteria bacterium]|nr:galactosyldiacylglycerol synthase [Acidobacteriota bacterium]